MTKWGVGFIIVIFVVTIFADWGANYSGMRTAKHAFAIDYGWFESKEEIPFDVISRRLTAREAQFSELSDTERRDIYKNVIDEIISERLAIHEAKERGLTATHAEIITRLFTNDQGSFDQARYEAAQRGGEGTQLAYYEKVYAEDLSLYKIFNAITTAIAIPTGEIDDFHNLRFQRARLRHILIRPGNFVSIETARKFYDQHPDSFVIPERVKGRHILFALPENPTPQSKADARGRAEVALLRIRGGESFNKVFAENKADTTGTALAQELDWFIRGQMVPAFDSVAFRQPVGIPTEIIETKFGYHIALFDAHEMAHHENFDDVVEGVRASLATDSEIMRAKALADDIQKKIASGEPFEALAREFSNGASGGNGGLLGDVIPGEMTPELYPDTVSRERIGKEVGTIGAGDKIVLDPSITQQLFELEIGKVSDVVASRHGFHILRIEARRGGDPDLRRKMEETLRTEYQSVIRRQIFNEWTKALRAKVTIEFSDDVKARLAE